MNKENIFNFIKSKLLKLYIQIREKIIKLKKEQKILIALGIVLSIVCFFINNNSIFIAKNTIKRDGYGGTERNYNLYVQGLQDTDKEVLITVSNRKYTKEEADELFDVLYDRTIKNILKDNENFENIVDDLNLFGSYKEEGVELEWEFEPHSKDANVDNAAYYRKYQNVIERNGKVNNYNLLKDEKVEGFLKLRFVAYINEERERYESNKYFISVIVHNRSLTTLEENLLEFQEKLKQANNNTKAEEVIILPTKLNNANLIYKEKKDFSCVVIFGLFLFAAFLISYNEKKKKDDEEKKRERSLMVDYPNIISKLLIYIGCGMTCRNAFIKIANTYENNLKYGIQNRSTAYDEIKIMSKKLSSGITEAICYNEFSQNINNKIYTRFISIIEQNIKNGSRTLIDTLQIEVIDAFEQRKLIATKLGEEASTKLIIPLMIMLGIVMIIVMVPALMAF